MLIKIDGIQDLQMARFCAGAGADMLGFSLKPPSEGGVSQRDFLVIRQWLVGVELVVEASYPQWQYLEKYKMYHIQCDFGAFFDNYSTLRASSKACFRWWVEVHTIEQVRWLGQMKHFRGYFQMSASLLRRCLDGGMPSVKRKSFVVPCQNSAELHGKGIVLSSAGQSFEQIEKSIKAMRKTH